MTEEPDTEVSTFDQYSDYWSIQRELAALDAERDASYRDGAGQPPDDAGQSEADRRYALRKRAQT